LETPIYYIVSKFHGHPEVSSSLVANVSKKCIRGGDKSATLEFGLSIKNSATNSKPYVLDYTLDYTYLNWCRISFINFFSFNFSPSQKIPENNSVPASQAVPTTTTGEGLAPEAVAYSDSTDSRMAWCSGALSAIVQATRPSNAFPKHTPFLKCPCKKGTYKAPPTRNLSDM